MDLSHNMCSVLCEFPFMINRGVLRVAEAEAIHHSAVLLCEAIGKAGMRHQGSVSALPRPRPSITTGQTHRDVQQTANYH